MQAQACLEHAYQLAPEEDYVFRHLQIVQNRISRSKVAPNTLEHDLFHTVDISEFRSDNNEQKPTLSDSSSDLVQPRGQPVKSGDADDKHYSSRVVNTEPVFVDSEDILDEEIVDHHHVEDFSPLREDPSRDEPKKSYDYHAINRHGRYQLSGATLGTDMDDPSSGMS